MINTGDKGANNINSIQRNIDHNMQNFQRAEEMLGRTTDEKTKRQIIEKNKRRSDTLNAMRAKIGEQNLR